MPEEVCRLRGESGVPTPVARRKMDRWHFVCRVHRDETYSPLDVDVFVFVVVTYRKGRRVEVSQIYLRSAVTCHLVVGVNLVVNKIHLTAVHIVQETVSYKLLTGESFAFSIGERVLNPVQGLHNFRACLEGWRSQR